MSSHTVEVISDFSKSKFVKCPDGNKFIFRKTQNCVFVSDGFGIFQNDLNGKCVFRVGKWPMEFIDGYRIVEFEMDYTKSTSTKWFVALQNIAMKNRYIILRMSEDNVWDATLQISHGGPDSGNIEFSFADDGNTLFVFENDISPKAATSNLVKYVFDFDSKLFMPEKSIPFKDTFKDPCCDLQMFDEKYIIIRECEQHDNPNKFRHSVIRVFDTDLKRVAKGTNGDILVDVDDNNKLKWYVVAPEHGTANVFDDEFKKIVDIVEIDKDIMSSFGKCYGTMVEGKFESHITTSNVKYVIKCDGMVCFVNHKGKIYIKRGLNELGIFDFTYF